jgi:hypothetical protein
MLLESVHLLEDYWLLGCNSTPPPPTFFLRGTEVLEECWYLPTKLHSVTSQETAIFIAIVVLIWNIDNSLDRISQPRSEK